MDRWPLTGHRPRRWEAFPDEAQRAAWTPAPLGPSAVNRRSLHVPPAPSIEPGSRAAQEWLSEEARKIGTGRNLITEVGIKRGARWSDVMGFLQVHAQYLSITGDLRSDHRPRRHLLTELGQMRRGHPEAKGLRPLAARWLGMVEELKADPAAPWGRLATSMIDDAASAVAGVPGASGHPELRWLQCLITLAMIEARDHSQGSAYHRPLSMWARQALRLALSAQVEALGPGQTPEALRLNLLRALWYTSFLPGEPLRSPGLRPDLWAPGQAPTEPPRAPDALNPMRDLEWRARPSLPEPGALDAAWGRLRAAFMQGHALMIGGSPEDDQDRRDAERIQNEALTHFLAALPLALQADWSGVRGAGSRALTRAITQPGTLAWTQTSRLVQETLAAGLVSRWHFRGDQRWSGDRRIIDTLQLLSNVLEGIGAAGWNPAHLGAARARELGEPLSWKRGTVPESVAHLVAAGFGVKLSTSASSAADAHEMTEKLAASGIGAPLRADAALALAALVGATLRALPDHPDNRDAPDTKKPVSLVHPSRSHRRSSIPDLGQALRPLCLALSHAPEFWAGPAAALGQVLGRAHLGPDQWLALWKTLPLTPAQRRALAPAKPGARLIEAAHQQLPELAAALQREGLDPSAPVALTAGSAEEVSAALAWVMAPGDSRRPWSATPSVLAKRTARLSWIRVDPALDGGELLRFYAAVMSPHNLTEDAHATPGPETPHLTIGQLLWAEHARDLPHAVRRTEEMVMRMLRGDLPRGSGPALRRLMMREAPPREQWEDTLEPLLPRLVAGRALLTLYGADRRDISEFEQRALLRAALRPGSLEDAARAVILEAQAALRAGAQA